MHSKQPRSTRCTLCLGVAGCAPLHVGPLHVPSQGSAVVTHTSPPAAPGFASRWLAAPQRLGSRCQSWLLPASRAGMASHGTVPPGILGGGVALLCPLCCTWQHLPERTGRFWGTLVALGSPHQMLFISV